MSLGRAGIVNIEREAGLSGKIHDKGVLILTNFLRDRFGQGFPLSLTASLCFEQSYGGVGLMLRRDVLEAVGEKRFHVWAVSAIDEGIEVLTGVPARTVNAKSKERLRKMAARLSAFEKRGK